MLYVIATTTKLLAHMRSIFVLLRIFEWMLNWTSQGLCQSLFTNDTLVRKSNCTLLFYLNFTTLKDYLIFLLISLMRCTYKVLPKVLGNCLNLVIDNVTPNVQSAFMKDCRHILDGIVMENKKVDDAKKKKKKK